MNPTTKFVDDNEDEKVEKLLVEAKEKIEVLVCALDIDQAANEEQVSQIHKIIIM